MPKHTHIALMTLAATGSRKELARGLSFTPADPQEARDLEALGQAAPIATTESAPAAKPAALEGGKE